MDEAVERVLGDLAYVSDALNKASDSLSKNILEVEEALQRYRLGVSAWVPIQYHDVVDPSPMSPVDGLTRVMTLGYGKLKGKWGLLVSVGFDDEPIGDHNISFLREEARDVKLKAVEKLPELLSTLLDEATNLAAEATSQESAAREIALGLKRWAK
jgi:hypothetical protein